MQQCHYDERNPRCRGSPCFAFPSPEERAQDGLSRGGFGVAKPYSFVVMSVARIVAGMCWGHQEVLESHEHMRLALLREIRQGGLAL